MVKPPVPVIVPRKLVAPLAAPRVSVLAPRVTAPLPFRLAMVVAPLPLILNVPLSATVALVRLAPPVRTSEAPVLIVAVPPKALLLPVSVSVPVWISTPLLLVPTMPPENVPVAAAMVRVWLPRLIEPLPVICVTVAPAEVPAMSKTPVSTTPDDEEIEPPPASESCPLPLMVVVPV